MAKLDPQAFTAGLPNDKNYNFKEIPPGYKNWSEVYDAQDKKLEELLAISSKIDYSDTKASLKGAIVSFPRGDGAAYYIVTKDKPLTVANIQFGDAWSTDWPTINGITAAWIRSVNRV